MQMSFNPFNSMKIRNFQTGAYSVRFDVLTEVTMKNIVAYLLKARIVELEKEPLLGNGCVTGDNAVTVGRDAFCAVRAEAI
jgi:hypothetical protein